MNITYTNSFSGEKGRGLRENSFYSAYFEFFNVNKYVHIMAFRRP